MCMTSGVKARPQTPPRPSRRLRRQRACSILLDSATALYVIGYLYHHPSYLNPWGLPNVRWWLLGFGIIRLGVTFYDHLVVHLVERCFKSRVLPTREPGAPPVRYVALDARSVVYLSINSLNEYAFVMRLTHYMWRGGHQRRLSWEWTQISLGNTLVAFGIMFLSMDMLYAPLHHALHLPRLYPLIHKHHHRQHFPTRGYLDAGNEHPIEHMIGVMCTWFAVCTSEVAIPTLAMWFDRLSGLGRGGSSDELDAATSWAQGGGVHAATVLVFFQLHAALACLNHSPYNVRFSLPFAGSASLLGTENKLLRWLDEVSVVGKWVKWIITGQWFVYSVGHHEMHHRKFSYNYGQYCMLYDRWMGTFLEYEGPLSAGEIETRRKKRLKEK